MVFYKHLNASAVDSQRSISSLPLTMDDVASWPEDAVTSTDDTTDVTSSAATSVEYLELKSEGSLGPDGMSSDDCAALWDDDINITSRRTHALLIGVSAYSTGTLAISNDHWTTTPRPMG